MSTAAISSSGWPSFSKLAQEVGIIVEANSAGMSGAEGVQQVREAMRLHELPGAVALHVDQLAALLSCSVEPPHIHLVRDERVKAIDGGELLGHGIGRAVLVRRRADDAVAGLAFLAEHRTHHAVRHTRPIGVHAEVQRRMREDARCPFDRVDLGNQGRVDQARALE